MNHFNNPHMPIQPEDRMFSLDVIRGFAILGILLVNMAFFYSPHLYNFQFRGALMKTPMDVQVAWFINVFAAGKFYTMFSFLFGLGMFIFLDRAAKKGNPAVKLFLRRLLILLGLGGIHAFFIWSGDILIEYALLGFVLILFRNRSPRTLLTAGVASISLPVLFQHLDAVKLTWWFWKKAKLGFFFYPPGMMQKSVKAYGDGTYMDMVGQRFYDVVHGHSYFWSTYPTVLAMFLLGLYAGKRGFFQNIDAHLSFVKKLWVFLLLFVVALGYLELHPIKTVTADSTGAVLQSVLLRYLDPAGAILYVCTLVLLLQSRAVQNFLLPISYVGRMAVSCYLATSLICTTIFYNYGFDLYNKIGPAKGLLMTFLIYTLLVVFAILWLQRYRFGPVEWVWRSLTYGSFQPMRKPQPHDPTKRERAILG